MNRFAAMLAIVCVIAMSVNPLPTARIAFADDACQNAGSLCAMLNLIPDLLGDSSGTYKQVYYDNYAEHLRRFGFTAPTAFEGQDWDNFAIVSREFVGAGDLLSSFRIWEWQMGYSPFLIDQAIAIENLPDSLTLLRGRFDQSSVESFWSQSGYTPSTVNGTVIWKLRGDYENDLRTGGILTLSRYNYAIFLRNDVIAYSSTAMGINAALQTASGSAPALTANGTIAQLLAHVPADLASAAIASGEVFANSTAWTIFGITPGVPLGTYSRSGRSLPIPAGIPSKRAYAALLYGTGVDLDEKASTISSTFLSGSLAQSETPYTDFLQDLNVTVDSTYQVVAVNYAPKPDSPGNLFLFLFDNDPGFLV